MPDCEYVPCNLCGHDEDEVRRYCTKMLQLPKGIHVVRCKRCRLCYMNPRPTKEAYTKHYEQSSQYQPESYLARSDSQEEFHERILHEMDAFSAPPGKLLEIGCATGNFLHYAEQCGWQTMGVEISPSLARHAQEHFGLDVRVLDDIRKADFQDGAFDVVFASNVLEHLPDPSVFLREAHRILKPEGILFLEVPNQFRHLREVLKLLFYRFVPDRITSRFLPVPFDSLHHCYFFSPTTITEMLGKSGFQIGSLTTYTPPYFRQEGRMKRWGGMAVFKLIDNVSILFKQGLCIKIFAQKKIS